MTNEELVVLADLITDVRKCRKEFADAKSEYLRVVNDCDGLQKSTQEKDDELNNLREREADALNANEDLKKRCSDLMAERDEARRKLGALLLCVGFHKCYDMDHPKRGMLELQAAVKKCIDDNHIVLTEGGMAK